MADVEVIQPGQTQTNNALEQPLGGFLSTSLQAHPFAPYGSGAQLLPTTPSGHIAMPGPNQNSRVGGAAQTFLGSGGGAGGFGGGANAGGLPQLLQGGQANGYYAQNQQNPWAQIIQSLGSIFGNQRPFSGNPNGQQNPFFGGIQNQQPQGQQQQPPMMGTGGLPTLPPGGGK